MTHSPQSAQSALPPAHVTIIMDGNRCWAKNRMLPTAMGHAAGAWRVRDIVQAAPKLGNFSQYPEKVTLCNFCSP